jgi:hypothetical protein
MVSSHKVRFAEYSFRQTSLMLTSPANNYCAISSNRIAWQQFYLAYKVKTGKQLSGK